MCIWLEYIPHVTRNMKDDTRTATPTQSLSLNISLSFHDCHYYMVYEKKDLFDFTEIFLVFSNSIFSLYRSYLIESVCPKFLIFII